MKLKSLALAALVAACLQPALADEWPQWRGPQQNGSAADGGLVSEWSVDGKNMAWKAPFVGRSTPVVVQGRVCVIGRAGEGIEKQETVACFDADTGAKLWERRHNVYHTTVAFNRVGWAALGADVETGTVYAHGVAGQLTAYDAKGEIVWDRFLNEELGQATGYGGRTQTPIVWGDQVLMSIVTAGWGEQGPPRDRYFAFDKRTGAIRWVSTPGRMVYDMNTQSGVVVAEIGGRHLLVGGAADGHVYGMDLATGHEVFAFEVSRRGLNSTPVVVGDRVFVGHSEENLDEATMGRYIAFDASGSGDLAPDAEIWRVDELTDGFPTPAYAKGKLYVVDNSATLFRIDAGTGKVEWEYDLGTVGKASPVVADGKIYVPELNGRFHILKDGSEGPTELDLDELKSEGDRYAEIYGSPAIAGGRVFLSTEGWLYAIGDKKKPYKATPGKKQTLPAGKGQPATMLVTPAEVELQPGGTAEFKAEMFDAQGLPLGPGRAEWSTDKLAGQVSAEGKLTLEGVDRAQGGAVVASAGALTAKARVRVVRCPPWTEDFEAFAPGPAAPGWIGAGRNFEVVEEDGGKLLLQPVRERGLQRSRIFFGGAFSNYTIQADVRGSRDKRRVTDVGLLNSGYTLNLMGYHQRIEIHSWEADKRMAQEVEFPFDVDAWYTMKLRVDSDGDKARIRGKVWKRGEKEPEAWTITAEDPLPIRKGSPGITGYAPSEIRYDNIAVTPND